MNVGTRTFTSTTHQGYGLTLFHAHPYRYQYGTIMAITSNKAIAMIDFNEVTITAACISCKGYHPAAVATIWEP